MASHLFGGTKNYKWLESFMRHINTIKYYPIGKKIAPYLVMAQSKLKLITILTNLLVTHMARLDKNLTYEFVNRLVSDLMDQSIEDLSSSNTRAEVPRGSKYRELKKSIPEEFTLSLDPDCATSKLLMPFGLNLLLEIAFIFVVQCKSEVLPDSLKTEIVEEYRNILLSLVQSEHLFSEKILLNDASELQMSKEDFDTYWDYKKRKMNS